MYVYTNPQRVRESDDNPFPADYFSHSHVVMVDLGFAWPPPGDG